MTASYHLVASTEASEMQGSIAWVDLQWSGAMAWMARAAYGPVSITYADAHLTALRHMCEAGAQ